MCRVYFDDYTIETSEKKFLYLLESIAGSTHAFALHFGSGVAGFPDITGNIKKLWRDRGNDHIQTILSQIDDKELHDLFSSLGKQIQKLYELDNQLIATIATFFDLPTPQTQAEYRKVARLTNKYNGAIWVNEPEYQQIAHQMRDAIEAADEIKQQIDNKVQAFLSIVQDVEVEDVIISHPTNQEIVQTDVEIDLSDEVLDQLAEELIGNEAEFVAWQLTDEEQLAKDLIDGIEGELDRVRAIQMLHLALRYQPTGIQASKAYMALGIKYEELKQLRKAIDCYTKALEVDNPNARLFLWRGQLYYKLGEWDKSQDDFEQALSFQASLLGVGLFEDEQESANEYLSKLGGTLGKK